MKRFTSLSILVVFVALGTATRCTAAAQSPAQGLVAAWSFDETSGDRLQDASGHSLHGVLRGATRAAGRSGAAIECRQDALVEIPHARALDDCRDGLTVSAWVNRTADTNWNTIISREIKDGWPEYFGLAVVKNKALFSVDGDGAHYQNIKSDADMPVGEWVHLAGTYDNKELKLYVNGRLAKSATYVVPFKFADTNPLLIGGNSNSQGKSWVDCFHGRIDEVRFYNRALAGLEILQIASEPSGRTMKAIEEAAPKQAPAQPGKPRKVLVYGRVPTHQDSVPCCFKALEILGQKTGAFEVVCTGDPAAFTRESLAQFDAVVMNNTHEHRPFLPPDMLQWPNYKDKDLDTEQRSALREREETFQKNLLEFVKGGKGLVGIHGAVCMVQWPEYMDMFGGTYVGHFVESVCVRPEDAGHPLCADLQGQSFEVREELYRFGPPIFSRDNVRVLLSLDPSKFPALTKKDQHPAVGNDYPVSWIRSYGQGRVFYCALGHMPEVFVNPHVLRHFLAGIQFAIGDLKADATPLGKAKVEAAASRPRPGDVFREYSWTTEKFHVFSLKTDLFALPAEVDLKDATRAEVVVELANQHMGFEGMAIRLNGNQGYAIRFPASSPKSPSPSLWFHHWYPTVPIALTDLKEGEENTFEMKVPAECFDGTIHPNGNQPLVPWCPLYGLTVRVYYDPARKPHPTGKVLTPAPQSTVGLSVNLTASAKSDNGAIRQIDFIGRYEDVNHEGDGIYDQWHGHLFHGKITHHLGSTTQPEGMVTWDTSWVPDQPGPMEIAARITDVTGLIYMTEPVGGLKLVRPGLSVELCKPVDVPRSFTGCQYGEWVIPGVRSQKFTVKGDLSKILDARYAIASWGNQKECPGYTINGVLLQDKPAGADYYYNLSMPPIRPLTALKAGENTFSTVVAKGRMPDIYMPGVQVLIRYHTGNAGAPSGQPTATPQVGHAVGQPATSLGVLLPGDKPTRLDVGATNDYVTADGTVWLADRGFNNGRVVQREAANVTGTRDPALFRTERNGMVDYTFGIPNGVYMVRLHLAETDPAIKTAGQRLFNVDINGWPIDAVDILAETRSNRVALVKSAVVEVTNGVLTIRFMQRKGNAKLDALEIIPKPGQKPPPKPRPKAVSRRLPPNTPPPARHFVLEDFENTADADLHKKWNQWGQLSYRLDPDNKSRGQFGVTHQVGKVNTSWFGYPPRLPKFSCAGMNAWRMWVKPDGSGRLATFFIKDSSQEVYCWVIPDLLIGTEPYILEVPLANYTYIFRENNAVFEPEECAEFGYWITGPSTFSLDDIMLVHNPDLLDPAKPASTPAPAALAGQETFTLPSG